MVFWLSRRHFLAALIIYASWKTQEVLSSCAVQKMVEDVAVTVVTKAAHLFFLGDAEVASCRPRDCARLQQRGQNRSGVYRIWPRNSDPCGISVYCDLEQHGGGWTIIQRRGDFGRPANFFNKLWRDYKFGFGNISEDFWLGNDKIFEITNQDNYVLRVDLRADTKWRHSTFEEFFLESETNNYTLRIAQYKVEEAEAGDSLSVHSGKMFSTRDRDNDFSIRNCAEMWEGAWWFNKCHLSHLNGHYLNGLHEKASEGIMWNSWMGDKFSYQETVMKIRPKWFAETFGD